MSAKVFAAIVGVVMIVVGLFLGFSSSTLEKGYGQEYTCGSAFSPDTADVAYKDAVGSYTGEDRGLVKQCQDSHGSKSTFAWVLIGAGVIAIAGGAFVRSRESA